MKKAAYGFWMLYSPKRIPEAYNFLQYPIILDQKWALKLNLA